MFWEPPVRADVLLEIPEDDDMISSTDLRSADLEVESPWSTGSS